MVKNDIPCEFLEGENKIYKASDGVICINKTTLELYEKLLLYRIKIKELFH